MKITLIIGEEEDIMDIDGEKTIKDLLHQKQIPLETVVVKKNRQIVNEEELLEDGDTIEIIRVIYGG
jgi:sulfur carrier protein